MGEPEERSDVRTRVAALCSTIQDATEQLRVIRESCPHPSYKLVWWMWGPGRIDPSRCCNECLDVLPGITEDERRELGPMFKHRKADPS